MAHVKTGLCSVAALLHHRLTLSSLDAPKGRGSWARQEICCLWEPECQTKEHSGAPPLGRDMPTPQYGIGEGRMKNQVLRKPKGAASRLHLLHDKQRGTEMPKKPLGTHITPATSGRPGTPDREVHPSLLSQSSRADGHAMSTHHQCWKRGQKDAAGALRSHITFSWKSELSLEDK